MLFNRRPTTSFIDETTSAAKPEGESGTDRRSCIVGCHAEQSTRRQRWKLAGCRKALDIALLRYLLQGPRKLNLSFPVPEPPIK
jgi:hypothetical protein